MAPLAMVLLLAQAPLGHAQQAPTVTASEGNAIGGNVSGSTISNTVNNIVIEVGPTETQSGATALADPNATAAARQAGKAVAAQIAQKLQFPDAAVENFLATLGRQNVPADQIAQALAAIAQDYKSTLDKLSVLNPSDPAEAALVQQAKAELAAGKLDAANALLTQAQTLDEGAIQKLEAMQQQVQVALDARKRDAAATLDAQGGIALSEWRFADAEAEFSQAAALVPPGDSAQIKQYLKDAQNAYWLDGEYKGNNTALQQSIALNKQLLRLTDRHSSPLDWALTENYLGNALEDLGERESGTDDLRAAVTAYQAALQELTRDRVPLDWAMTENNLGIALGDLGERESGTDDSRAAVTAFQAALQEWTRDRVPLDWATTENNLGNALDDLGERESGTDDLRAAVTAYQAALQEQTRDRVPLDWAMTEGNLGNALEDLGERESGTDDLRAAVTAYQAALQELTRDRVPLGWAMTENNLGNALDDLGVREQNATYLQDAVTDWNGSLSLFRNEPMPPWATTIPNRITKAQADISAIKQEQ